MDLVPVFRDEVELQKYLGTQKQLEEIGVMFQTQDGRKELLALLKKADPALNGNVEGALNQIDLNREQLEKKESFLKKMLKMPVRALKALGRTMRRHPILTALGGLAAVIALLYFMPALAPTAGEYGRQLIEAFKGVLQKVGLPTPSPGVDAISKVPITGGPVSPEVVERAGEILQSPGTIDELSRTLQELSKP
jgi:hypothetical protein